MKAGDIWRGTIEVLRYDGWTFFALAAPFTLLVDVFNSLFGPAQPQTMAEFTPRILVQLLLIPGIIGAIAQLAVARLVVAPGSTPRSALTAAFAALPVYVLALAISAFPTGLGLVLLVIPGLYLLARLFLVVPIVVVERLGPVATLQRSWLLTEGQGGAIMLFIALAILFTLGAGLLAGGVGAALGSVLTLAGLKPVGIFVAALLAGLLSTALSIASATSAAVIYRMLRAN